MLLLRDVDNNNTAERLRSEPVLNAIKAARNGLGLLQILLSFSVKYAFLVKVKIAGKTFGVFFDRLHQVLK